MARVGRRCARRFGGGRMTSKPPVPLAPVNPALAPQFLSEALEETDPTLLQRDAAALLEALAPATNEPVDRAALLRLTQAVSHGAQRFAPFFDQLQELYQRDE